MRTIVFLFLICFLVSFKGKAQDTIQKSKLGLEVKVDLLYPFFAEFNKNGGNSISIAIEKYIFKRHSLQFAEGYNWGNKKGYNLNIDYLTTIIDYRFYPFSRKKQCFGPYMGVYGIYIKEFYDNYTDYQLGYGGFAGYKYGFKKVTLELLIGLGNMKISKGAEDNNGTNLLGRINFCVGYKL